MTCPISIMNVTTREVKEFSSITKCAHFLGIKTITPILDRLNARQIEVPYRNHFIKATSDKTPWPETAVFGKSRQKMTPIKIKNLETGEISHFRSIASAANKLNMNTGLVFYHAYRRSPVARNGFFIRAEESNFD